MKKISSLILLVILPLALPRFAFAEEGSQSSFPIAAGDGFSCAILYGSARCWGLNSAGQLGNNSTINSSSAIHVAGLSSGVHAISAGSQHACAAYNGVVKCWGSNSKGQLGTTGIPVGYSSLVPVSVSGLTGISSLSAGSQHSCAVTKGAAKCWGLNDDGQLGNNSLTDTTVPVAVNGLTSGVTQISAGANFTCAVINGAAKCWGNNLKGQLGVDPIATAEALTPVTVTGLTSGVTAISAGNEHACALVNSLVKCWGDNSYGQLGNNTLTNSFLPVSVITAAGQSTLLSGATSISADASFSCAVVSGAAKCWGSNTRGQLGNNSQTASRAPVSVTGLASAVTSIAAGSQHACVVINGAFRCWGDNTTGEIGNSSTTTIFKTPQSVAFSQVKFSQINPAIFQASGAGYCISCHVAGSYYYTSLNIRLDFTSFTSLMASKTNGGTGPVYVLANDPTGSKLYQRMKDKTMPTGGLSDANIQLIYEWIADGAQNN